MSSRSCVECRHADLASSVEMNWLLRLDHLLYLLWVSFSFPWGPARLNCGCCGRFVLPERSLCHGCSQILEDEFALPAVIEHPLLKGVNVRFIYDWQPGESDFLSVALTSFKKGSQRLTWQHQADQFLSLQAGPIALHLNRSGSGACVLVPVPSSTSERDHAGHFAEGLARVLGTQILAVPRRLGRSRTTQKRKSRKDRLQDIPTARNQERTRLCLPPVSAQNFILIDDILTTGATTFELACEMGWPWDWIPSEPRPRLEIWVLAYRSRLAP